MTFAIRPERAPTERRRIVEVLLAGLPRWFADETARRAYADAAEHQPMFAAFTPDDAAKGYVSLSRPFGETVEIHSMAVAHEAHRQGIGTALVDAAVTFAEAAGALLLAVKTLGAQHPSPEYRATRAFYGACGFLPVSEHTGEWGNLPTLVLVKPLTPQ